MAPDTAERGLPVVAVVGRPNVGKSSLVNRVLGRRAAIVEPTPGVTRDRRGFIAEWGGRRFEIFDTGGLEPGARGLEAQVRAQAEVAIASADLIVLVVDVQSGLMQDDHVVADSLRRSGKPVLLVANKVDDAREEPAAAEYHRLGLGEPQVVSALHGRGSGDLLDRLLAVLPRARAAERTEWVAAAIVGRPNVGKSSLLNALLGTARAIVDERPGTTRDPVDSYLALSDERVVRILDTAGMRREVQIKDPIEYFGWLRSRDTLRRADIAILVIDVSEGITSHDQRIAQEVVEHGRACVVALNKWDLAPSEETDRSRLERALGSQLRFLAWAETFRVSALTKRGIDRLPPAVVTAVESHRRRLPTSLVNRVIADAQEERPHPRLRGKSVRIRYAVQASTGPPRFILFCSARLEPTYLRYIERRIRSVEPFTGSPLSLEVRRASRDSARDAPL
ncbi:MAG: ribosome biogenesis GTPase Der [Actinomycetota bacterium]